MHPAYSVILFTTMSGAGYGLLIWLSALGLAGALPPTRTLGFFAFGLAFALIGGGLMSSTAHLGRPERAWRAFSQWRSSWLSREGVLAVASFVPAGLLAINWIFYESFSPALAWATIALSLATVYATGMIYQSLPTIRAWHNPLVTPIYLVLAIATGGVIALFFLRAAELQAARPSLVAIAMLLAAAALKWSYWTGIDSAQRTYTAGAATGLGQFGKVRMLISPHSTANYVMREMGYSVGRRHANKLRRTALWVGLIAPALLTALSLYAPAGTEIALALLAVAAMAFGIITERWLFFAEAEHVVNVYYGAEAA